MPQTLLQFIKFGIVGTAGFIVDAGVLAFCMTVLGMGPYGGRAISFLVAVTATWLGNRFFTFKERHKAEPHVEWAKFAVVCLGGFALNYGTYAALIATVPLVATHPTLGVAAGSVAGLFFNFFAAKKVVFST